MIIVLMELDFKINVVRFKNIWYNCHTINFEGVMNQYQKINEWIRGLVVFREKMLFT